MATHRCRTGEGRKKRFMGIVIKNILLLGGNCRAGGREGMDASTRQTMLSLEGDSSNKSGGLAGYSDIVWSISEAGKQSTEP